MKECESYMVDTVGNEERSEYINRIVKMRKKDDNPEDAWSSQKQNS